MQAGATPQHRARPPRVRTAGLPEPIMMNLAGCTMDTPSRSTVLMPLAALSSTTSTRPSSSRLTSSTYRMPRLALACGSGHTVRFDVAGPQGTVRAGSGKVQRQRHWPCQRVVWALSACMHVRGSAA